MPQLPVQLDASVITVVAKKLQQYTFIFQIEEVSQQVHSSGQELESSNQQISVLRRDYQGLEIELQSELSRVSRD